jgi:hypothetical protein
MKRNCREIVLASALGVAFAACSSTRTSTDNNGLIENNSDAAGVSAGEAELLYGASGTAGTGTASGTGTSITPQSSGGTNNSGTHY